MADDWTATWSLQVLPPRWWRRSWKVRATRGDETLGPARIEGGRRVVLEATSRSSRVMALRHAQVAIDQWEARHREWREHLQTNTLTYTPHPEPHSGPTPLEGRGHDPVPRGSLDQ